MAKDNPEGQKMNTSSQIQSIFAFAYFPNRGLGKAKPTETILATSKAIRFY